MGNACAWPDPKTHQKIGIASKSHRKERKGQKKRLSSPIKEEGCGSGGVLKPEPD